MGYSKDRLIAKGIAIEKAITADPSLNNMQLKMRFDCSESIITRIRKKIGSAAPSSEYVTDYDLKHGKPADIMDVSYRGIFYGRCRRKRVVPSRVNKN